MKFLRSVFLLVIISALLFPAITFADTVYVKEFDDHSELVSLTKDDSGNVITKTIRTNLPTTSNVRSFKHKGNSKILLSELDNDAGTHVISIYNPSDLTAPLVSKDIYSTNLTLIVRAYAYNNNLIISGYGNDDTNVGAILEIDPETCETVSKYDFGEKSGETYQAGDMDNYSTALVHDGKIYAWFGYASIDNNNNLSWKRTPVEMDGLGNITDTEILSDLPELESYNVYFFPGEPLYLLIRGNNEYRGIYKLNDFTFKNAEKIIDEKAYDICSDKNGGLYYSVYGLFSDAESESDDYTRYIYHWDGTNSSRVYDLGEMPSWYEAHEVIAGLNYDADNEIILAVKEQHSGAVADENGYEDCEVEAQYLLAINKNGNVIKELENFRSMAIIETSLIEPVTLDSSVLEKLAALMRSNNIEIESADIKFITDDNISEPSAPTQSMKEFIKKDGYEPVKNLNVLTVKDDGYYVFLVNVPSDLVGTKTSSIKLYALKQADFTDSGLKVKDSFFSLINGILNFGEITNLTGEKVDSLPEKILAIGFLQGGQPFSIYIAKILLAILTGGCNFGINSLVILCVSAIIFARRK